MSWVKYVVRVKRFEEVEGTTEFKISSYFLVLFVFLSLTDKIN